MVSIIFALSGIVFAICGYFYAANWEKQNKKEILSAEDKQIQTAEPVFIIQEVKEEEPKEYIVDKMLYSMPSEDDIDYVKTFSSLYFDSPERILETWLRDGILYGPNLINPVIEHFKTIYDEDMPPNYIEEVITEFFERLNLKLFAIKNKRFKLIKRNDVVAKEFSKELYTRNENCKEVKDVLSNLGYGEIEIRNALTETISLISDFKDSQQILCKALNILSK